MDLIYSVEPCFYMDDLDGCGRSRKDYRLSLTCVFHDHLAVWAEA